MQPEELKQLKKIMAEILTEGFRKPEFKKIVEEICKDVIKKTGMTWA